MLSDETSPYLMEEPPTSPGRVLLSRAFSHWCVLHHGYSDHDIYVALDPEGLCDDSDRRQISWAARLLGELLCAEEIRAFTRPIGGGNPEPLAAWAWERDDFRSVFARSAIALAHPFDEHALPTHWIFLHEGDYDSVVQRSLGPQEEPPADVLPDAAETPSTASVTVAGDGHIRMPELERRTGMSRATIYRRIAAKRFPDSIPMEGNIAAWRERDVAEWLANPR